MWTDKSAGADLLRRRRRRVLITVVRPDRAQAVKAANGATNREVAAQIYPSPRTVDKVFAKLGVGSRAELIRRTARDALDDA